MVNKNNKATATAKSDKVAVQTPAVIKSLADISDGTLQKAIAFLKEQKITKLAHRPNGKVLYLRPIDVSSELRDAIQAYLTKFPKASIHDLAEIALCKMLNVKARPAVEEVTK